MKEMVKKLVTVLLVAILIISLSNESVEAKVKTYSTEKQVTMTGKIKKVKYYMWNGMCETNYVLYTNKKFRVKDSGGKCSDKQRKITVLITKKQWKKYKNKKVMVKGTLGVASPHYCTNYDIYNIIKIKKIKK